MKKSPLLLISILALLAVLKVLIPAAPKALESFLLGENGNLDSTFSILAFEKTDPHISVQGLKENLQNPDLDFPLEQLKQENMLIFYNYCGEK